MYMANVNANYCKIPRTNFCKSSAWSTLKPKTVSSGRCKELRTVIKNLLPPNLPPIGARRGAMITNRVPSRVSATSNSRSALLKNVGNKVPQADNIKGAGCPELLNQQPCLILPNLDKLSDDAPGSKAATWPAPRPWAQVLSTKLADTVDDILLHLRRHLEPAPRAPRDAELLVTGVDNRLRVKSTTKPVVLVLGTGWGAHSLIKVIDTDAFEVVVVSPRNHFIFTPMLPSAAVGTVEFRSLLEPIRVANPFISYFGAECEEVDLKAKVARCKGAASYESGEVPSFEVHYDVLVVAVGEQPATFGVPGVKEHCYFMKEMGDAVGLRNRIGQCFELASLPNSTEEERQRLLSFIVVGGGPAGVEFAGTLEDFLTQDLRRKYPELMKYVRVTLLQAAQSILTQFSAKLQQRALENLRSQGITVRMGVRVTEVNERQVLLGGGEALDYGVCVWSTGNAARPLVADMVAALPEQREANVKVPYGAVKLAVDPYLRVVGAEDVIALGDCSVMTGNRLPPTAQVAGQQGAYAARAINRGYSLGRGGVSLPPPSRSTVGLTPGLEMRPDGRGFRERIVALELRQHFTEPFEFLSLGIMAYVGNDRALTQVEAFDLTLKLYGTFAFLLWRSVYITKQVSLRNRVLILADWVKTQVFGRDLSQF